MNISTVGIRCAGCSIQEVHPLNGSEDDAIMADMQLRGWRRRSFGPNASPWFCSGECAYGSLAAKQAEDWWVNKGEADRQREFHRYFRDSVLPRAYYISLIIFSVIITLLVLKWF